MTKAVLSLRYPKYLALFLITKCKIKMLFLFVASLLIFAICHMKTADKYRAIDETNIIACPGWKSIEVGVFRETDVFCKNLLFNDFEERVHAESLLIDSSRKPLDNTLYKNLTQDCNAFKTQRGYITCPLTSEEENFSVAFSIRVHNELEMVERLLRAIYRPQNYYCIHVDKKSDARNMEAISLIAGCFDNVFIASERIDVQQGTFSVLEADLSCMTLLWKYTKWKYIINLTGQDFPLRTNWELVQILKVYSGANDIEKKLLDSTKELHEEAWKKHSSHSIQLIKGSIHMTASRDFIDYVLHNQISKDFLEWAKNVSNPENIFFSTLYHNIQLGIRGSYKETNACCDDAVRTSMTRFKGWNGYPLNCRDMTEPDQCILVTGDLPILHVSKHLFASKFDLSQDYIVVECLEEMLYNNTRDEVSGVQQFNTTFYTQLDFVSNRII